MGVFPWLFPSGATLGLSDRSYDFSASVIALRKWSFWCPFCWASVPQRSLLVCGAAGGGAVTYCCRSLSCDGHSLVLCGCLCLLVRATSVWLECTFAEHSAVCFVPMGMRPFSFLDPGALYALAVPDSLFFADEVLSALNRQLRARSAWIHLQLHCVSGLCLV